MYDVVTIGTAASDIFLSVPRTRVCFEPGSKTEVDAPVYSVGGGAVNAAVTCARQGLKTAAVFAVGRDRAGDDVVRALAAEGVQCETERAPKIKTAQGIAFVFPDGERSILVYRGAAEELSARQIPFDALKTKWVYLAPGGMREEIFSGIMRHYVGQGTQIAINPSAHYCARGGKLLQPYIKKIGMVVVNKGEAARWLGVPPEDTRTIFRRLDAFVEGIAIMTDGPRGAWVSDGKKIYHAGIYHDAKVIDRTGAGDAFGAGFLAGLIRTNKIPYALRLASANAAAVTEKIGAHEGALTKKEFENNTRWKKLNIHILES